MAHGSQAEYLGWCEACRKRLYVSRKQAKKAIREKRDSRLRPYACPVQPLLVHVGHIPQRVKTGDITAREYYGEAS